MLKAIRPDFVPLLNLEDIPGYETSSEEEDYEAEFHDQEASQSISNPGNKVNRSHFDESVSEQIPASDQSVPCYHYKESYKYISDFYEKRDDAAIAQVKD